MNQEETASYIAELEAMIDAFGEVTPQQYQKEIAHLRIENARLRDEAALRSQAWNDAVISSQGGEIKRLAAICNVYAEKIEALSAALRTPTTDAEGKL